MARIMPGSLQFRVAPPTAYLGNVLIMTSEVREKRYDCLFLLPSSVAALADHDSSEFNPSLVNLNLLSYLQ